MQLTCSAPFDLTNYFFYLDQIYSKDMYQILGCRNKEQTFNCKFPGWFLIF